MRISYTLVAIVLAGLLIRVAVMPFAMHVDPAFVGDIIAYGQHAYRGVFQPGSGAIMPPYPPLANLSAALIVKVLTLFSLVPALPCTSIEACLSNGIFLTLFALKAWYLPFDLGIFALLTQIGAAGRARVAATLFWAFNPLILYTAYLHGQYDLVPLFFVALGLYSAQRRRNLWAAFWFGIGACFKMFPFLFLVPLVLIGWQTWRGRIKAILVGVIPYAFLALALGGLYGTGFNDYVISFFHAKYDLGSGGHVYFFFVFYAMLAWYLYGRKAHTFEDLWRACFAILLAYYPFSYSDLHYWAWVVPFAAIYWVECSQKAKPFYAVILTCLLVLTAAAPLARFLAPVSPRFFLRLPSLLEALSPYLPMLFIVNAVRSLLAGTCFCLAWKLLRDMPASFGGAVQAAPDPGAVA